MNGSHPVGNKWNYDSKNRKLPQGDLAIPDIYCSKANSVTKNAIDVINKSFSDHFGDIHPFYLAVTREQALDVLDKVIKERLEYFGDCQDAMIEGEPWM